MDTIDYNCLLCGHELSLHKVRVFSSFRIEDGKPTIGYRISCENEKNNIPCTCNCGLESTEYAFELARINRKGEGEYKICH